MTSPARWPRVRPPTDPGPQLSLLQDYRHEAVETAKGAGTAGARRGDPDLYDAALAAIEVRAATGEVFSADDIRGDLGGVSGPSVGSAFRTAATKGAIRIHGVTNARSLSRHGSISRLWRGVR